MKKMIWLATFWTYSLTYGPNQGTQPFNLKHINGSGLGGSYLDTLIDSWTTSRMRPFFSKYWTTLWKTLQQWSSTWVVSLSSRFHRYPARHRDVLGGRQTYAGRTALRVAREAAWHNWQAYLDMRVPETVGVATFPATGASVYRRKLSPGLLNKETRDLIRRYAPKDWLDD